MFVKEGLAHCKPSCGKQPHTRLIFKIGKIENCLFVNISHPESPGCTKEITN